MSDYPVQYPDPQRWYSSKVRSLSRSDITDPQDLEPLPEYMDPSQDLLSKLFGYAGTGLEWLGYGLDTPRALAHGGALNLKDMITGRDDFQGYRASGQDLIQGLTGSDPGFWGGLATEVALDPLNLPLGLGALLKLSKIANLRKARALMAGGVPEDMMSQVARWTPELSEHAEHAGLRGATVGEPITFYRGAPGAADPLQRGIAGDIASGNAGYMLPQEAVPEALQYMPTETNWHNQAMQVGREHNAIIPERGPTSADDVWRAMGIEPEAPGGLTGSTRMSGMEDTFGPGRWQMPPEGVQPSSMVTPPQAPNLPPTNQDWLQSAMGPMDDLPDEDIIARARGVGQPPDETLASQAMGVWPSEPTPGEAAQQQWANIWNNFPEGNIPVIPTDAGREGARLDRIADMGYPRRVERGWMTTESPVYATPTFMDQLSTRHPTAVADVLKSLGFDSVIDPYQMVGSPVSNAQWFHPWMTPTPPQNEILKGLMPWLTAGTLQHGIRTGDQLQRLY